MKLKESEQGKIFSQLADDEIMQGFKDCDSKIVREYFYGYCRVAYCIYDKRYDLRHKPGMDFYSLAHEYDSLSHHAEMPEDDARCGNTIFQEILRCFGI